MKRVLLRKSLLTQYVMNNIKLKTIQYEKN